MIILKRETGFLRPRVSQRSQSAPARQCKHGLIELKKRASQYHNVGYRTETTLILLFSVA